MGQIFREAVRQFDEKFRAAIDVDQCDLLALGPR